MDVTRFTTSVMALFQDGAPTNVGVLLSAADVIAPGMIVLQQRVGGDFELYFDADRWVLDTMFSTPDSELCPPQLQGTALCVMNLSKRGARTFSLARAYARGMFNAVAGDQFFDHPQPIDLQRFG